MKVVTLNSLKLFLDYLKKNFKAPFAERDGDGNIIKDTYIHATDKVDFAKKADVSDTCAGKAETAGKAEQLSEAREVRLTGGVSGTGMFDGSGDLVIETTIGDVTEGIDALREDTAKSFDSVTKDLGSANEKIAANEASISSIEKSFRQKNTSYKEDDTVLVKGAGVNSVLRCVKAGTTGAEEDFLPEAAGFKADSLDGFKYDNVHIGSDGYVALGSEAVAAALLETGGGNGKWAHTDAEGSEV